MYTGKVATISTLIPMETKDLEMKNCEKICHEHGRGLCFGCMWSRQSIGRWIMSLLLLALVFVLGFKLGELKSRIDTRRDESYLMSPTGRIWNRTTMPQTGTWDRYPANMPSATTTQ